MNEPSHPPRFLPLRSYWEYPASEMLERSRGFAAELQRRCTVRQSSDRSVSRAGIEACGEAAGTAPRHAHAHAKSDGFPNEVMERPVNERALMLVVVGYPAPDAVVPDLHREPLSAIATLR